MEDLLAMGFEKSKIQAALHASSNNIDAALELLLSGEEIVTHASSASVHVSYFYLPHESCRKFTTE
jgi:hypothetical protein